MVATNIATVHQVGYDDKRGRLRPISHVNVTG